MYKQKHILSTRPLSPALIQQAAAQNIIIEEISFIRTESVNDASLVLQIESLFTQQVVAIFTSMNAAEAVGKLIKHHQPEWTIFALGTATKQITADYFTNAIIHGGANNAAALSKQVMAAGNINSVTFFCGDQRRDELPQILNHYGVAVKELIVYKTFRQHHAVQKHYDGIMFFSPSAVESFFETNTIDPSVSLFAIGNTTANTIEQYSANKVITSDHPGKEELVKKLILHFTIINQQQ